ncbi:GspH/FimT family pseudopilin [Thermodesulfobacteriota bacterium]
MALESLGKRDSAGFTLIQLITVIGVIAILASIAIPGFLAWRPKYLCRSAARDVYSYFQVAKMEAVRSKADVVITFSMAGRGRFTVFVDDGGGVAANAGNRTMDAGERQLARITMPQYVNISSINFTGGSLTAGYNARGLPVSSIIGNVTVSNTQGLTYQIILSMAGNLRINEL